MIVSGAEQSDSALYTHASILPLVAQTIKNLPASQETRVQFLGREDLLEKGMTIHSSILPWRDPWAEGPGGLQSMRLQRVGQDRGTNNAAAKSLQSCPTLCDPIDGSPPGSPVPGILQARTLEWAAISFSNA